MPSPTSRIRSAACRSPSTSSTARSRACGCPPAARRRRPRGHLRELLFGYGRRASSAPLHVTGCSALPYAPKFTVTATEDSGDNGVKVTTDITQKANEATSRSVALQFPAAVLAPNAAAVINGGILCTDPTFASCKTVGSASSTSPLYPTPLIGKTYLTGSLTAPAITISFPPPFALTLNGSVDLATNTTTFSGLPDIPLTDLVGHPRRRRQCRLRHHLYPAQRDGDQHSDDDQRRSHGDGAGCLHHLQLRGGSPRRRHRWRRHRWWRCGRRWWRQGDRRCADAELAARSRASSGRDPNVTFTAHAGRNAPKLRSLLIGLPAGLDFVLGRVHHRLRILDVRVAGARVRSLSEQNDLLFIRLRSPVARVTVKIGHRALRESLGLALRARHRRLHSLTVGVIVRDAAGSPTSLTLKITRLHL